MRTCKQRPCVMWSLWNWTFVDVYRQLDISLIIPLLFRVFWSLCKRLPFSAVRLVEDCKGASMTPSSLQPKSFAPDHVPWCQRQVGTFSIFCWRSRRWTQRLSLPCLGRTTARGLQMKWAMWSATWGEDLERSVADFSLKLEVFQ